MKIPLLMTLVCFALLMVSCRQHDYREITLNIPEMRNAACARAISVGLSRAPGLQRELVKFDVPNRTITVRYDSLLAADKNIEFLVVKTGFSVNGIPADAAAQKALPADCLR
jgi:copper chaperone CopZ